MYIHAVYLFSLGSMVDPLRKPRLEQGQLIAWVSCGGRNEKGACEGGEGEDMMACSRVSTTSRDVDDFSADSYLRSQCDTVRYCSKGSSRRRVSSRRIVLTRFVLSLSSAHQKANWKTHKKTCFKPAW